MSGSLLIRFLDFLTERYPVYCPGCGARHAVVIDGDKMMALHPGCKDRNDRAALSSPNCVPAFGFVGFEPCGHCCPETFATCPDCELQEPGWERGRGTVTNKPCQCTANESAAVQGAAATPVQYINTGNGLFLIGDVNTNGGSFIGRDQHGQP